jgi:hypothetical protein
MTIYSIYLAYTYSKLSGKFRCLSRYGMAIAYTKYKPFINLVCTRITLSLRESFVLICSRQAEWTAVCPFPWTPLHQRRMCTLHTTSWILSVTIVDILIANIKMTVCIRLSFVIYSFQNGRKGCLYFTNDWLTFESCANETHITGSISFV